MRKPGREKCGKGMRRFMCGALIILLILQELPLLALAAGNDEKKEKLYIRTAEDFLNFAMACRDADYSVGLEVILKEDIDLGELPEETQFKGISSFSGIFRGYYHSVSGVNISEGGDATGLFCHLEQGALVDKLTVKGNIDCSAYRIVAGGIAGTNAGTIRECLFKGMVSSLGETGGIVGINGTSGSVVRCSSMGSINGLSQVGGIAGENRGVITDSKNYASVNAGTRWLDFEGSEELTLSAADVWNELQEKIEEGTDFGGIAGWSNGLIAGCENKAVVGYQHAGKNIGGIVGRQSGQLLNCTNEGRIYGKQDVGGIVGQFEPQMTREDMEELGQKVTELHDLINNMITDMEKMGEDLHEDFSDINEEARETGNTTDAILTEMREVVEQNVDTLNQLTDRIDYCVNHFSIAMQYLNQAMDAGKAVTEDIERTGKELEAKGQSAADSVRETFGQIEEGQNLIRETSDQIQEILKSDNGNQKEAEEFTLEDMEELKDLMEDLSGQISETGEAAKNAMQDMDYADSTKSSMDQIAGDARRMNDSLQAAGKELQGIVDYLGALDRLHAVNLSNDFDQNCEKLKTELATVADLMDQLNDHSYYHSRQLESDMRAINDKMNEVLTILVGKLDQFQSLASGEDVIEDLSAKEPDSSEASGVKGCSNLGVIFGDRSAGGIAGTMNVEEIQSEQGSKLSVGSKYLARCILTDCKNHGFITVKNEYGGGIVGDLEIGFVSGCIGSGRVQGEAANYLGGIAGKSSGTIENCSCLAVLDGSNFIGGIAGEAGVVRNCYSLVTILGAKEGVGAIIGRETDEEDEEDVTLLRALTKERLNGNYYCSTGLYGINGVSYTGAAQSVSYEELLALEDVPEEFSELSVTFLDADQNLIRRTVLPYGSSLAELDYPALKTDSGEYMEWKGLTGAVLEGNLVLQASEMENVTVLSGTQLGKTKPVALAMGTFTEEARIFVEDYEGTAPADAPAGSVCHLYRVRLEKTSLDETSVSKVRLLREEGKTATVYLLAQGKWKKLSAKTIGSYEEVSMPGTEAVFCVATIDDQIDWIMIAATIGAGVLCLILLAVLIHRIKRRKKQKEQRKRLQEEIGENPAKSEE